MQHKNKGGGPCGAPVNHWLRVHADQMRGIKESVLYFYYDFIYIFNVSITFQYKKFRYLSGIPILKKLSLVYHSKQLEDLETVEFYIVLHFKFWLNCPLQSEDAFLK